DCGYSSLWPTRVRIAARFVFCPSVEHTQSCFVSISGLGHAPTQRQLRDVHTTRQRRQCQLPQGVLSIAMADSAALTSLSNPVAHNPVYPVPRHTIAPVRVILR
ncbi:unnamed protein product, partial [Ectocarpus sp. 4 AP-2014]